MQEIKLLGNLNIWFIVGKAKAPVLLYIGLGILKHILVITVLVLWSFKEFKSIMIINPTFLLTPGSINRRRVGKSPPLSRQVELGLFLAQLLQPIQIWRKA